MGEYTVENEKLEQIGVCKYCGQSRMMIAPKDMSVAGLNELASMECECEGANFARRQQQRLDAAREWSLNIFSSEKEKQELFMACIEAVFAGAVKGISVQADGKNKYKIALDKDDMLRISREYRDQEDETF